MLLRAIFLCIAIATLAETMLQAAAALAVVDLHRHAVAAAKEGLGDAEQRAQSAIAAALAQGEAPPSAIPSPEPTCVLANAQGCTLVVRESIALSMPSAAPCLSSECSGYAQANDAVGEGRVIAAISADALESSGTTAASANGAVVFRTLRFAPYALPAGAIDASLDDAESGAGDAGGIAAQGASAGTLIDVVYQNAQTGALMPANVWAPLGAEAPDSASWTP
ncbi:MAG: hypothetical protein ACREMP_05995 [Candidatus Tyrphobacter sp.]